MPDNYEKVYHLLNVFLNQLTDKYKRLPPTPQYLALINSEIKSFFSSDPTKISLEGLDLNFHLHFTVLPNNMKLEHLNVCLKPLTPIGLDMCMAWKIPIDDSLQTSIRKLYNDSLAQYDKSTPTV